MTQVNTQPQHTQLQHTQPQSSRLSILKLTLASLVIGSQALPTQTTSAFAVVFHRAAADQGTDDFNLAVGLYRSGRLQLAADTLRQFLKDNPGHPRESIARLYLGLSLSSMENYRDARPYFAEYLKADADSPLSADARYRLGECSYHLMDYTAAIQQLQDYLQQHPEHTLNAWARLFLGSSLNSEKQWVKAETVLRDLISSPSAVQVKTDAQFFLANSFEGQARLLDAIAVYREVAKDRSSVFAPRALAKIGTINFNQGKYKEAAEAYDSLVSQFSDSSLAESGRLNSGVALYRDGRFEDAIQRLRQIPRDSPNAAQALFIQALSLRDMKDADQARAVFADALSSAGESALATDIVFQRAQFERVEGQFAMAARMFEDMADRWPTDPRIARCLFNAAEISVELKDTDAADRSFKRLARDFPQDAARAESQVLFGRILLASKQPEPAIAALRNAIDLVDSSQPSETDNRTGLVARYYLARTYFDTQNFKQVVEITRPVTNDLKKPENKDLVSMLALAAISALNADLYADARTFADDFLALASDGLQIADVLATRCVAFTHLKEFDAARTDADNLVTNHDNKSQTWTAVLQAAEVASDLREYSDAYSLFEFASKNMTDPRVQHAGQLGMAWSLFHQKEFPKAESMFASMATQVQAEPEFPQVIYMQARCMEEAGDLDRAAVQYAAVFEMLTKDVSPAPPEAETSPPLQYAFDSGRQAARIFGRFSNVEKADQVWAELIRQFPAAKNLDQLLEEWAWLNVAAQRFEQSDKIYRQLLDRFPNSRYAGQARLSLAESDLAGGKVEAARKEFESIVATEQYGANDKETALFHLADIATTQLDWKQAGPLAEKFVNEYPKSSLLPRARLIMAEALLKHDSVNETDVTRASEILSALRDDAAAQRIPAEPWTDRIWVVQAQAALLARDYPAIDNIAEDLTAWNPESPFMFQVRDIQGRRWKNQAPPDFARAREYFRQVITDKVGAKTETAAQCHFLLAETYVLEKEYKAAIQEFFKIRYLSPYDIWREQSLFQIANCQLQLGEQADARKTFEELIKDFPESRFTKLAEQRLKELSP